MSPVDASSSASLRETGAAFNQLHLIYKRPLIQESCDTSPWPQRDLNGAELQDSVFSA